MLILQTLNSGKLGFSLDLHRDIERQFSQAHGAAAAGTHIRSVEFQDEVGKSIDDIRLLVEPGRRIDHAEYARPGRHAIEVAQRTFEAGEDGECDQAGGGIALLKRNCAPELA